MDPGRKSEAAFDLELVTIEASSEHLLVILSEIASLVVGLAEGIQDTASKDAYTTLVSIHEQDMLVWPHGTNPLQMRDTLDESMGSLVLVGNLASASMLEVQAFCRYIEDLDSFVDHEQPTTKEVVPVRLALVTFIMAAVLQAILVVGFSELMAKGMAGV